MRWNKKGTRLRLYLGNFEEGEKQNVLDVLKDLQHRGASFVYEDRNVEAEDEDTVISELAPSNDIPEKIKLIAMGKMGTCCYNVPCEIITDLKFCAGCGHVMYCSKDCQTKHWKAHRVMCRKCDG
jgi:hypothetical protein